MQAMILKEPGRPLEWIERDTPVPGPGEVLVKIFACAVCRTDLHVVDGDLTEPKLPIVPGHEIVGTIAAIGRAVTTHIIGDRVGVPWLGHTCGQCPYCQSDRENLCDAPGFTGYQRDGGFATHTIADADYCLNLPDNYDDLHAAPLLCAGLIGHRSLKAAGTAERLGIYGFGAAAHIVAQVALHEGRRLFAFTRPGDLQALKFAREIGCHWAGGSDEAPPEKLDAAIIFAPVGNLVPAALANLVKGGVLVLGGIHMSQIPAMPYELLWGERVIRSIANLTRQDARDFLDLAARVPIETTVVPMDLTRANEALHMLRAGELTGAAVLVPPSSD